MSQLPAPQTEPISENELDNYPESGEPIESVAIKLTPEAKQKIASMKRKTIRLSLHHDLDLTHEVEISLEHNRIPIPESILRLKQQRAEQIKQLEQNLTHEAKSEQSDEFSEQRKELNEYLRVGSLIEKLRNGQELENDERLLAANTLEQQGWQKLLTELKPGDRLVSILVPSDAHVSIKNLNDNIFGPRTVDLLIEKRKQILDELLSQQGIKSLNQSYKDGYFKIQDQSITPQTIHKVITQANQRVTQEIQLLLEKEEQRASGDPQKLQKLKTFKEELVAKNYEMTFGLSSVGTPTREGDLSHIERAVSESIKGASLAREPRQRDEGILGIELSLEKMSSILSKILSKRDTLLTLHQNTVLDSQGHAISIFHKDSHGNLTFNIDLIRDIRKKKFIPSPEHEERVSDIQEYMKMINILDVIKPFTHEEFNGSQNLHGTHHSLGENVTIKQELIDSLRGGGEFDREKLLSLLSSEGKDQNCTSAGEFHARALQEQQCTYVSIDVLDVGPGLLQEFDYLLNQVSRGTLSFDHASLRAGDQTTKNMRQFRSSITDVTKQHTSSHDRPLMFVGGDEAILALPTHSIHDRAEFLLALRKQTNTRVIETVIGESERSSHPENGQEQRKTEHLQALKDAESGADAAKELERSIHSLRLELDTLPKNDSVRNTLNAELSDMNLSIFTISKERNKTRVIREQLETMPIESLHESLQSLTDAVSQRFEELTPLYQERFPKAGIVSENIRQVTRLENLLGSNSELFIKIINGEF